MARKLRKGVIKFLGSTIGKVFRPITTRVKSKWASLTPRGRMIAIAGVIFLLPILLELLALPFALVFGLMSTPWFVAIPVILGIVGIVVWKLWKSGHHKLVLFGGGLVLLNVIGAVIGAIF